jgi:DNA-binding NarL/FixJ family response regulator
MPPASVLIVEDQKRFRESFIRALSCVPELELVGVACDLPQGRRLFDSCRPDVLLVDLDLPGGSGIELIRHASQVLPRCDPVVISVFGDEQHVLASIEAGATGYLLKDAVGPDLAQQLHLLRAGGSPLSPAIARCVLRRLGARRPRLASVDGVAVPDRLNDENAVIALSDQESRVLHLAAKGFTFEEVARLMQVSPHTVMTYVKRVYRKLHVGSKVGAIYEARRLGWLRD